MSAGPSDFSLIIVTSSALPAPSDARGHPGGERGARQLSNYERIMKRNVPQSQQISSADENEMGGTNFWPHYDRIHEQLKVFA